VDDLVASSATMPADYLVWLSRYLPPPPALGGYAGCVPEADLDGDGAANVLEYLSGTNPVRADSAPDWHIELADGVDRNHDPVQPPRHHEGVKEGTGAQN